MVTDGVVDDTDVRVEDTAVEEEEEEEEECTASIDLNAVRVEAAAVVPTVPLLVVLEVVELTTELVASSFGLVP